MPDVKMNVTGDSSGGQAAMEGMGEAVGKSAVKWQEMANAAKFAAKAVVDFVKESVKQYAESDRIQKQLARTAGAYTDALTEQAQALSKLYAVDDDLIMQSETLLTQWGGVGAATKDVEIAALNLASAMGTDLNTATTDLIRNVESGGTGLAKMGIHFKTTGDKGKDLAAAIAAINAKLGGAAGADAASLTGQLHAADLAFEDIQKTIGGTVSKFLEQSGATNALTSALRNLNEFIGNEGADKLLKDGERMTAWVSAQRELAEAQLALREAVADPNAGTSVLELFSDDVSRAQAKVNALKASAAPLLGDVGVTGTTNKGMKDAASTKPGRTDEERLADAKAYYEGIETIEATANAKEQANYADELAMSAKRTDLDIKEGQDRIAAVQLFVAKENELFEKQVKQRDEALAKMTKETNDATAARMTQQAQQFRSAGDAIGAAFVNGLSSQLEKLAQGEEFDVALFVGDILASVIAVAGTVIGTAYGQPALGAAVGNLAAMGVRAGAGAISANAKKERAGSKKYHDGGWVDAPRHHDGSWIGADERRAILQTDERVLSRREVHHMGGKAAVDNLAQGRGGGPTIINNIRAIDTKSAAESFVGGLGKGLKQALRTGQGDVPRLLGMSPR